MPYTLTSDAVLLPDGEPTRGAVHVDGMQIVASAANETVLHLDEHIIAPGFVDLQVNGGGDVLFNDSPTPDAVRTIVSAHTRFGTTTLLPTFMTGPVADMSRAAAAVAKLMTSPTSGVGGIHFEGPAFSPLKLGIHDPRHRLDHFPLETLIEGLPTLVTLAPEVAGSTCIRALCAHGVRVSAGHSNATAAAARDAIEAGVSLATHLFNAMSQFGSREPGVTGTFLARDDAWVDFICDGQHVDFASLKVAARAKPRGKCLLVTDAMPPLGGQQTSFGLGEMAAEARDGACWLPNGTLAGSVLDLATAVRNCINHLGVTPGDALRMASTWPAQFMGFDDRGEITPGRRADLVVLTPNFEVRAVVRAGAPVHDPDGLIRQ